MKLKLDFFVSTFPRFLINSIFQSKMPPPIRMIYPLLTFNHRVTMKLPVVQLNRQNHQTTLLSPNRHQPVSASSLKEIDSLCHPAKYSTIHPRLPL